MDTWLIIVVALVSWSSLLAVTLGLWIGFERLITPTPKPEWNDIDGGNL